MMPGQLTERRGLAGRFCSSKRGPEPAWRPASHSGWGAFQGPCIRGEPFTRFAFRGCLAADALAFGGCLCHGLILVIAPVSGDEIEGVFAIAADEKQEKPNAQRAISQCGPRGAESRAFRAHGVFKDKAAPCDTLFNYGEFPFDAEKGQEAYDFPGRQGHRHPSAGSDRMNRRSSSREGGRSR